MQKIGVFLLVTVMTLGCLVGCNGSVQPIDPGYSEPSASPTKEVQSDETEFAVDQDSYWVAETYCSEDGEAAEEPTTPDPKVWFTDLMLRADGTARFRDVRENVCLMNEELQPAVL